MLTTAMVLTVLEDAGINPAAVEMAATGPVTIVIRFRSEGDTRRFERMMADIGARSFVTKGEGGLFTAVLSLVGALS